MSVLVDLTYLWRIVFLVNFESLLVHRFKQVFWDRKFAVLGFSHIERGIMALISLVTVFGICYCWSLSACV